jgi:hypothetical protein
LFVESFLFNRKCRRTYLLEEIIAGQRIETLRKQNETENELVSVVNDVTMSYLFEEVVARQGIKTLEREWQ